LRRRGRLAIAVKHDFDTSLAAEDQSAVDSCA
jgi:hypothetical protein